MKSLQLFKASLFFLFPILVVANSDGQKAKHTEKKTIKKEFRVNADATLKVDNSYGNLNIVTWGENRIVIEVTITTEGDDPEEVQKKLDDISVRFNASPNLVSAETLFDQNNSSWWDEIFGNGDVSMQIDYLIKMPITNQVDLNNDYGSITLDKLKGRAVINCDYGKITTKELMADNNSLSFDYSDNCYFGYIKSGSINADYSGFTVGKTKHLEIIADYTDSQVEIAEKVRFDCDYGGIEIEQANTIKGSGDYLTMRFGKIHKSIRLESDYGSIEIDQMMANAENVNINTDYTGIKIGVNPDYAFRFSFDLEYASLKAPNGFEFSKEIRDSGDEYYEGFYGSSNSGNSITIESDYGSVDFYVK